MVIARKGSDKTLYLPEQTQMVVGDGCQNVDGWNPWRGEENTPELLWRVEMSSEKLRELN